MALPTSTRFDIVDFSYRANSSGEGQAISDAIFADSFNPFPNVLVDGDGIVFSADTSSSIPKQVISALHFEDGLEYIETSSGTARSGIPSSFTFEFDITLTAGIPKDFSNVRNRVFVGAMNQQGYSGGLLFSHQGIALASHPEDPTPNVLGGSLGSITDVARGGEFYADGTNVRIVVNGELGRVSIYLSPSADAYDAGSGETNASIAYSFSAKPTETTLGDAILIQCFGDTAAKQSSDLIDPVEDQSVLFALRSIRLSSGLEIPEDAPVAVVDGPQNISIGSSEDLVGINSYDPEGREVFYNWEIEIAPEGSEAVLQGHSRAVANIQSLSTFSGDVVDSVRVTHLRPTAKANTFGTFVSKRSSAGEHLSIDFDAATGVFRIDLAVDADGNVVTTVSDLVAAFTDRLSPGFNIRIAGGLDQDTGIEYPQLFRADLILADTSGDELVLEGSHAFSGGSGSSHANPKLMADKEGVYVLGLQVTNNRRKSRIARLTLSASLSTQLLGHRPHTKYIFKYLSDFWDLVKDRDQIESIWSSVTQVLSNEMLQTWQNDYAKSLKDISRKYQRRWMHYPTKIDVSDVVSTTFVVTGHSVKEMAVPHVDSGSHSKFAEGSVTWDAPLETGLKMVVSSLGNPYIVEVVGVTPLYRVSGTVTGTDTTEHSCSGIHGLVTLEETTSTDTLEETGFYRVTTASNEFQKYRVVSERSAGYFVVDPVTPNVTSPIFSDVLTDRTYPFFQIDQSTDLLRIETETVAQFSKVIDRDIAQTQNTARLIDLEGNPINEQVNGMPVYWDHLENAEDVFLHTVPYLTIGPEVSLQALGLLIGDSVTLNFIDPFISRPVTREAPILATRDNHVFVDWSPIIAYLNDQAARYNSTAIYTIADLAQFSFAIDCFYRNRVLEEVPDVTSVPSLGFNTIVPEYAEGVDYSVEDGVVSFIDYFVGYLSTSAGSAVVSFNPGYKRHQELKDKGFDIIALASAGVHAIQIESGADAGLYLIQSIDEASGDITLDRELSATSGRCIFRSPVFCAHHRPSGKLWAELSYFDNWKTIQNNFGLFVGLPKELVDSYDPDLDYLSVIKSMWFAFLSGPSFDNITLAVQSLFGLPYTETASQLVYHELATPQIDGTLLLTDEEGTTSTYTYPYGARLAMNPRTGRQISVFRSVNPEELKTLSPQDRLDLNDSVVDAYTRLVDVVKVDDYISNPLAIENAMSRNDYRYTDDSGGEHVVDLPPSLIQKYHTFLVDVPLTVSKNTSVFPLISDFLKESKPAYTNFILQGSVLLSDDINVVSDPKLYPTLLLRDTPHTSPFFATKTGTGKHGEPVVPADKEAYIWPDSKTKEKYVIDYTDFIDASHFCLSGPYFKHVDILAGESWLYFDETVIGTNVGRIDPDGTTHYNSIISEVLKTYESSDPRGGIAIAVPGTGDYEMFSVTEKLITTQADILNPGGLLITELRLTLSEPSDSTTRCQPSGALAPYSSMNCLFFDKDNFLPPIPLITYWDDEDVKEKYESGYSEGVLDDYSGDGSWNMRRSQLDMVNTVNSDLDVVRCRQWVQIEHDFDEFPEQRFFQVGETISLVDESNNPVLGTLWDDAPPVVLHVGYGENPKLPHVEHPAMTAGGDTHASYLILGFEVTRGRINSVEESDLYDYEAAGVSNYGHEERLDVIRIAQGIVGSIYSLNLRGNTSGATANAFEAVDRDYRTLQETIWQTDKLIENGPASDPNLVLTTYVPVGGMVIDDFRLTTPTFDPNFNDQSAKYQWEAQQIPFPYYPLTTPEKKMIPSFNPGFYTNWAATDTAVDKVVWGFDHDGSSLISSPVDIASFERPRNHATAYLQNVHIGMKVSARKGHHVTHGFTNFRIPAPSIKMVLPSSAGYDLRICGFYFCEDDPSRIALPTVDPESYGDPAAATPTGVIGGSWVFFRDSDTLEEYADVEWDFETGNNEGLPILPKEPLRDGTPTFILGSVDQRSDGHIIECHIPRLPSEGYYDIIIRNYRPYLEPGSNWGDGSHWRYHMDETVATRAYYHAHDGRGGPAWGTSPFGTGGNS
jgi:hypothetical protein